MAALALAGTLTLGGCGPAMTRPQVSEQDLLKLRTKGDEQAIAEGRRVLGQSLERAKAEYDRYTAGGRKEPPVIDILIISGGGDWGAFGAGFLKGWQKVPAQHPLAKPEFDAVTGVSTGTLIAPFAFLGDRQSIDEIVDLYRNPQEDWVKQRGFLYFLPDNISFAEVPGLEREIRKHITADLLRRIAKAGPTAGSWRLTRPTSTQARRGCSTWWQSPASRRLGTGRPRSQHHARLRGFPAFPFRIIDDELYVDGSVTGNIIYGSRIAEKTAYRLYGEAYPNLPSPKFRFWVIFNNQFRPVPVVTAPNWVAVIQRSFETSSRAATATAVRHLFAMAEISRLKRNADVEVRVVSIPGDWVPPVPGVFKKETMNNLADLGEKMGADPSNWSSEPSTF
jgi:hypothetical protein